MRTMDKPRERRSRPVQVMFSEAELEQLTAAALAEDRSLAGLVRRLVLAGLEPKGAARRGA